jgi:two-component system, NtrC family, sensor kinase
MRRRSGTNGKPVITRRRKAVTPKRRDRKGHRRSSSSASLEAKVTRLTRELNEALQRQRATAEVLGAISRSKFELQSILQSVVDTASQLCRADASGIFRLEAGVYRFAAGYSLNPAYIEHERRTPISPGPGTVIGRAAMSRRVVRIEDAWTDPLYEQKTAAKISGGRSMMGVPLMREGEPIGVIGLARTRVEPFTEREIELVTTFADQAVIAIENVRLFEAEQQRTRELSESLEQQTATSEVLQVISSSPGDLQPVFDNILKNATRLCEANFGNCFIAEGDAMRLVATHNTPPAFAELRKRSPLRPSPGNPLGRMLATRAVIHVADLAADQRYIEQRDPEAVVAVELGGIRTFVAVPMLKENELIGALIVYRQEPRPFTDKQIALVTNFAAQAVIAVENTRLLGELRERTGDLEESLEYQTATSDVLEVISRSAFDLQPILEFVAETAARLCAVEKAGIYRLENRVYRLAVGFGFDPAYREIEEGLAIEPGLETLVGRTALGGKTVHILDAWNDPHYVPKDDIRTAKVHTLLGVPLIRDGMVVGVITLARETIESFSSKQIELVRTFADQAVIAIENVRLLNELRQRTDDLTKSLEDLRSAQDRLVQTEKLASLGQLTAGIAHEIKNPLNFVNNFSAVSVELIDELREALGSVHLDNRQRAEISEIADTLQGNLDKVVQHGKRADAIVKNMLLHSRQGSGEHRPVDINALVDESLNLAYHGARAEKQGFNITLERSFDPTAGEVDLFPQEITRALLNLISNGFYAATKRKAEANGGDYEPTLAAATKNLGDSVEIRIRDNGTGIPPEAKEKLFNPFFTTKPAGEGTGLGLSISHDIIVKQHGGSIEVDTQPGAFTEFRIVLPRAAASAVKSGGRA